MDQDWANISKKQTNIFYIYNFLIVYQKKKKKKEKISIQSYNKYKIFLLEL